LDKEAENRCPYIVDNGGGGMDRDEGGEKNHLKKVDRLRIELLAIARS